jgi:hypothetical protein
MGPKYVIDEKEHTGRKLLLCMTLFTLVVPVVAQVGRGTILGATHSSAITKCKGVL